MAAKKDPAEAGKPGAVETTAVRALRLLDVDGVRIEEGATAEIRTALVTVLVEIGAAEIAPVGAAAS